MSNKTCDTRHEGCKQSSNSNDKENLFMVNTTNEDVNEVGFINSSYAEEVH